MSRFSATTESEAVVAAERSRIWAVLTDPVLLPRLTPLLKKIETDGASWRWHLVGLSVLGDRIPSDLMRPPMGPLPADEVAMLARALTAAGLATVEGAMA